MQDSNFDPDINWFNKAMNHNENGESAQALLSINFYCEQNPDDASGLIAKAMINTELSNFSEAEKALKSIDLDKNSSDRFLQIYYTEWASLYKAINKLDKAIEYYDKRINISPEETGGYIFKGAALAKLGKYEEAKKEHLKATKLEGNPEEAFTNLGLILRAELKLGEAQAAFENSLKIISKNDEGVEKYLDDVTNAIELQKKINAIRMVKQQRLKT